jgi:hypothetical protein
MTRLAVLAAAAALAAAFTATSALAKGASEATITGPGLGDGITLAGEGQLGGERLMQIAESAGFFPALFVTTPNPMRTARPAGELGPRYTIAYQLPGPNGHLDEVRQDLYPYAKPDPVTYVKSGVPYWATEKTVGGWYVASSTLKEQLVELGLPRLPPTDDGASNVPWPMLGAVVLIVVALLAGVALFVVRTRPRPATA